MDTADFIFDGIDGIHGHVATNSGNVERRLPLQEDYIRFSEIKTNHAG